MSNPEVVPISQREYEDPIYIIYSGLNGQYKDIIKAYSLREPAVHWCREELKRIDAKVSAYTSFKGDSTLELAIWHIDESGKNVVEGFSIVEKEVRVPRSMEPDESQVHVVYDERTLEISYISLDYDKAVEARDKTASKIVKSIPYLQEPYRVRTSPFSMVAAILPRFS